jgi:hypothetical protein
VFSTSVGTPYAPGPGFRFSGGPGPAGVPYSPGEIRTPLMESAEANDWSREEIAAYASAYGWTQLPAMSGWGRPGEDAEMREVYREMMRDESVKAAVLQKCLGVSSLGLSFVLPKGWEGNAQAARINDFVGYNFEEHLHTGWPQTAWSLLSGLLQEGHVLGEPVMEKAPLRGGPWDGKRPLAKIKSKDPKSYDLILDPFLNLHAVRSRMNLHVVRPAERYLVVTHLPIYENPLGTSDLRAAYRAFVCKDAALKLRQLFLDKYAGPFLYATTTDAGNKLELAKDLKKARAAGYIVLPPGSTLNVLNLATASDAAFKSAMDDYDRAILIGILGSYLHVLEGQTQDGRGDTKVHRGVAELFQWFLAETLANAISRQVVPKIVHENFWLPCYPRAVLEAVDPNQIKSELAVGTLMRNAGVATSLSEWYKKSRWARPTSKEDTLEGKPVTAPGGSPFGFGGGEAFSDDEPDEPGSAPADALVAGPDGERAGELLAKVIADGSRRLADAATPAVRRLMGHPLRGRYQARLFSDDELHRVAGVIAESMAHGDLLGRAAVRDRWRREESGEHVHCDQPAGLRAFADVIEPAGGLVEALAYFRGLEPSLSAEPDRFGPLLLRRAFTLAQDVDRVVLKRVQDSIAEAVRGGLPVDEVARSVDEILDDAGVGPRRRGYSELVVRTNMADAYTAGIEAERNDPEVRDAFPAWYYAAVIDGRERPTHGARHGMLFHAEVPFNAVRGTEAKDVCQCRCVPVVVTRRELSRLRAEGKDFSDPREVVHGDSESRDEHGRWSAGGGGKGDIPGLKGIKLSPKRRRQLRERIDTYVRVQIGLGKDGDTAEKEITAKIAEELKSGVTRHAEGEYRRPFAHAGFDPSKHPRGNPGNSGQFARGTGSPTDDSGREAELTPTAIPLDTFRERLKDWINTWMRHPDESAKVNAIRENIRAGRPVPPVVVKDYGGGDLELLDGSHRAAAFLLEGKKEIPAFVVTRETEKLLPKDIIDVWRRRQAHAEWEESKHRRGQPGNRGEFGPGGGGIASAVSAVAERAKANVRAAVGHLPDSVRVPLGNAYHAVHSSLMAVNRSARTLARRVAEERGGSPEHVERLSRVLAAADLIVPGAVGLAVASTGAVAAGKLASYIPVGSMSYVLYSSARNPAAVLRAAGQALGRDFPEAAKGAWRFALGAARHPLTPAVTAHAAFPAGVGLIDDYLRHFAAQGEFAEAALLAALDETRDVASAVRMASQVASRRSYAEDAGGREHKGKGKGGGQFAKKGEAIATGGPKDTKSSGKEARVPEEKPSEKALRAKAAHHLIDKSVQRYAEEHNEPRFAKAMGGVSFPNGEPADVVLAGPDGRVRHGIELKTMVDNKNNKITMKRSAMDRKAAWERKNKATFHTVVLDDHAVFNANGPGEHDESKRRIFYRRGFGSFRVGTMYEVKGGLDELKRLLDTPKNRLPAGAR